MVSGVEGETLHVAGFALGREVSEIHGAERDGVAEYAHYLRCLHHPLHGGLRAYVRLGQKEALVGPEVVHGERPPTGGHFED
jgi:hypothetical protein